MHSTGRQCTPRQSKSPFFEEIGGDLDGERGYLGSFSVRLGATTKIGVVNFFGEEKCTPRQNPGYAYDYY